MALAACHNAIFNPLLPLGILLLSVFPPDILLFGANLSHVDISEHVDPPYIGKKFARNRHLITS